jgi:drug/metabolite transporter (DMT)-like permease
MRHVAPRLAMTQPPTPQRPMTGFEWSLMLLLSLLWGGSFFFVGILVKSLPPLTIVALRVGIAAAALWATGAFTGLSPTRVREAFPSLVGMSILNNVVPFTLLVWAQTRLPSGFAAILNATTPVMTVIAAHFLTTTEKLTRAKIIGALIGFVGVAAMVRSDFTSGLSGDALAEAACLVAALFYALSSIYARRFRPAGLTPIDVSTGQLTGSALLLLPLALLFDQPWTLPAPSLTVVLTVLAYALLSSALAYIVFFRILAGAGATNVVLVTLLAPATTIVLGAFALGERLEPKHFLGLALIAVGLAFIDGRLPAMLRSRARSRQAEAA